MEQFSKNKGIVLAEALLAVAVFALLVTGVGGALLYAQESRALAGDRFRAVLFAKEGLEAVRSIRDRDISELQAGTYGVALVGSNWQLDGAHDDLGVYRREVVLTNTAENVWEITTTVSWQANLQRRGEVSLTTSLTNWQRAVTVQPDCTGPPEQRPPECDTTNGNGNNSSSTAPDCSGPAAQRPPECA